MGTTWQRAEFPEPVQGEMSLTPVPGATLTKVARGKLRVVHRPNRWKNGAVYDSQGRLVVESQKIGGLGGGQFAPADPGRIAVPDVPVLPGRWLYGGHWMRHFGHFFTETITTLWPTGLPPIDGLIFHIFHADTPPEPEPWQREFLTLLGLADVPIRLVHKSPVRVADLLVPTRSVVLNGWVHPEALTVWDRVSGAVRGRGAGDRVFLSRARFHAAGGNHRHQPRTTPEWDAALDEYFASRGFAIVSPETLTIPEQLAVVSSAKVLAGPAGSALHLACFGPSGRRVLEIGDSRLPHKSNPMQQVVNAVREHEQAFVPYGDWDRARALLDVLDLDPRASGRTGLLDRLGRRRQA